MEFYQMPFLHLLIESRSLNMFVEWLSVFIFKTTQWARYWFLHLWNGQIRPREVELSQEQPAWRCQLGVRGSRHLWSVCQLFMRACDWKPASTRWAPSMRRVERRTEGARDTRPLAPCGQRSVWILHFQGLMCWVPNLAVERSGSHHGNLGVSNWSTERPREIDRQQPYGFNRVAR